MKRLSVIFMVLLTCAAYGQKAHRAPKFAIDSADWITDDLEGSLTFYKNQTKEASLKNKTFADFGIYAAMGKYTINKDTLVITHEYDDNDKQHQVERFKFLVKHLDKQKLVLQPIVNFSRQTLSEEGLDSLAFTDFAGRPRRQEPEYHFENLQYAGDRSFKFKQLSFKPAPGLTVQIDNTGIYYLRGENPLDSLHYGFFKGVLNGDQLDTLNNLLQKSQIRKMRDWPNGRFADNGDEYELAVDYDNGELTVKTDVWPICTHDLLMFLKQSYQKIGLEPIYLNKNVGNKRLLARPMSARANID